MNKLKKGCGRIYGYAQKDKQDMPQLNNATSPAPSEKLKDKIIARQCLNFKGFSCNNKDCKNIECPLHKDIPEHLGEKLC